MVYFLYLSFLLPALLRVAHLGIVLFLYLPSTLVANYTFLIHLHWERRLHVAF